MMEGIYVIAFHLAGLLVWIGTVTILICVVMALRGSIVKAVPAAFVGLIITLPFLVLDMKAEGQLLERASVILEKSALEGSLHCGEGQPCRGEIILESGGGERFNLEAPEHATLVDGDAASIGIMATPRTSFTVPALCRKDVCWPLRPDEAGDGICRLVGVDLCGNT